MTISASLQEYPEYRWFRQTPFWGPLAAAAAYYLGAQAAFAIGTLTQQFAPFWPPNVILLCTLLIVPRRHWPLYIAATLPAHLLAERGVAMPLLQMFIAFTANVAVTTLNAVVLQRLPQGERWLGSLRNASRYMVLIVIVNPASVALIAGFEPIIGGGEIGNYWSFWWRWYLSNAVGALTLMPVFLTWLYDRLRRSPHHPEPYCIVHALLLAAGLAVVCTIAFDSRLTAVSIGLAPALFCLPVPLLVAAAVRFRAGGASGAILMLTAWVLIGAMHGHQPFAPSPQGDNVIGVQLFLAVIAVPVLLLGAVVEELQQANGRLGAVLRGISDCFYTVDCHGRVTAANAQAANWWGKGSSEEVIGRNSGELAGDCKAEFLLVQQASAGAPAHGIVTLADGRSVDVHAYPSAGGGAAIFYHDVTERRRSEDALKRSEADLRRSNQKLERLLAQMTEYQFALDRDWRVIECNHASAAEAGGGAPEHLIGRSFWEIFPEARGTDIEHQLARALNGEAPLTFEAAAVRHASRWWGLHVYSIQEGISVFARDITDFKRSEDMLRRLSGALLRTQDEERRRIARELHDSTAQNLLGATLGIGQALRLVPSGDGASKLLLEESRQLIDECQRELRTMSYLLHPPMLDEAGLPAALRWFCDGFAKRTELLVHLDVSTMTERLPVEIEAALFRIAQEGLTNVHRHAGSTSVHMALCSKTAKSGRQVTMTIVDDGKGMPGFMTQAAPSRVDMQHLENIGIGLTGMSERLRQLGGSLDIRSGATGTSVLVRIPVPTAENRHGYRDEVAVATF